MREFHEVDFLATMKRTAGMTNKINQVCQELTDKGYSNLFLIGVGGTYCQFEPYEYILRGITKVPVYAELAAEFMARPHQAFDDKSLVFVASRSGDTKEIIQLMHFIKEKGNTTIAFLNDANSPIGHLADYILDLEDNKNHSCEPFHMLFSMTFYKLLALRGEFEDYDSFVAGYQNLGPEFLELKKQFDPIALDFAKKHKDTDFHFFISSGSTFGEMYGQAMCIFEEMQWIKAQSVKSAEFFHGALEIVEKDTSVVIVRPEDWSASQTDRAIRFCKEYTDNLLSIDLRDYKIPGMQEKFRPFISALITSTLMERLGANISVERNHSLDIRRYYRQFDY